MVSVLTKTTAALLAQLARLDALAVEDAEKVKAECDRATALNNTARNIQGMLDLHLRAEMLQMNGYDRFFDPGAMFADAPKAAGGGYLTANAWGDGSRTTINEMGEFCDE